MFARTPRLLLRPGWPEDAQALHAAMSDEAIVRNLATVPWPYGLAEAQAFLLRERERSPRLPGFLAFNRTQGKPHLVGGCGIGPRDDGRLELGYWIARPYWGLGFATEAAGAVMRIARATGLRNVTARHFIDNPASGRVMRKIGFRPTGEFLHCFAEGRGEVGLAVQYEDGGEAEQEVDMAGEFYEDADFLAA